MKEPGSSPDRTSAAPTRQAVDTRVLAILFADAADYSEMAHRDEITASIAVNEGLALFRAQINTSGGQVLNLTGDGIVAGFDSAATAIRCALDIQNKVEEWRKDRESRTFSFRIGMHIGKVIEVDGNAYGDAINLAARIEALCDVGSVWVTSELYETVRGRSEFGFEHVGAFAIKNVPEPVDVYRVHDGSAAATLRSSRRGGQSDRAFSARGHSVADTTPSIAVLPFKNSSGSGEQEFFADGVTEDIIINLTRFRGLNVIARGSTFAFKGTELSPRELGQELGARYVAQGSIRQAGNRVRVTVELDDTMTERVVWSERYDRPIDDIFAIQDEITELAVGAMAVRLETAETERLSSQPPKSMHAYGLVLRGQAKIFQYTPEANREAQQHFTRALSLAPGYARALAALSRAHSLDWRYSWSADPAASLDMATTYAMEAVAADANDARGHAELGFVQLYRREHERSIASYRRALSINPNDANIIAEMADAMTHSGHSAEALTMFKKAMRLNPFYPDQYLWDMAGALMLQHRFEDAIDNVLAMNNIAQGRRVLAACYAHLGRLDEARREADLIRAEHPGFTAEDWAKVIPEKTPEGVEIFVSGLKLAGL